MEEVAKEKALSIITCCTADPLTSIVQWECSAVLISVGTETAEMIQRNRRKCPHEEIPSLKAGKSVIKHHSCIMWLNALPLSSSCHSLFFFLDWLLIYFFLFSSCGISLNYHDTDLITWTSFYSLLYLNCSPKATIFTVYTVKQRKTETGMCCFYISLEALFHFVSP